METGGSVTGWIAQLQAGDTAAAQQLWERYFRRLVGLARTKLHDTPRRVADEEDVALSAFDTFCRRAEQGQFPQLQDRDSLWRLLVVITARKAWRLARDQARQKRQAEHAEPPALEQVLSREPTPEFAAQVAEECQRLLKMLGDPELAAVAIWKMEGCTTDEIAAKLEYAPRSIKRKVQLIRDLWEKEASS